MEEKNGPQATTVYRPVQVGDVLETLRGQKAIAPICREQQVTDWLVYKWRQEFLDKAPGLFESKQAAASGPNDQAERIAELERLVGQLTWRMGC